MKTIIQSLRMFAVLTVLTGVLYPLVVTLAAKAVFARQANGSVITADGKIIGSELLAQRFANANYFWPRPSAGDNGTNYATVASSASNKGPTGADLKSNVTARAVAFRQAHGLKPDAPVPSDMLFASGSGLDPHISPQAARMQIERVAEARKFSTEQKQRLAGLVEKSIEPPQLGFLGEPRLNVLKLNLAVDGHPTLLSRKKPNFVIPDEEAAAFKLLAQKMSGPRYFQPNASRTNQPSHGGTADPRISVADARLQMKRIAAERNLGPETETKLNALIERLTEPPRSRVVGEPEVNLLRLNLALDELAK